MGLGCVAGTGRKVIGDSSSSSYATSFEYKYVAHLVPCVELKLESAR